MYDDDFLIYARYLKQSSLKQRRKKVIEPRNIAGLLIQINNDLKSIYRQLQS